MEQRRTVRIDDQPEAVRLFFKQLGDQAVIVELAGKPVGIFYPAWELSYTRTGTLADSAGGWKDLIPLDVLLEIGKRGD